MLPNLWFRQLVAKLKFDRFCNFHPRALSAKTVTWNMQYVSSEVSLLLFSERSLDAPFSSHLLFLSCLIQTGKAVHSSVNIQVRRWKKDVIMPSVLVVCFWMFEARSMCLFAQTVLKESFFLRPKGPLTDWIYLFSFWVRVWATDIFYHVFRF